MTKKKSTKRRTHIGASTDFKYFEPNTSGKLKGYCKACKQMIIEGEDECIVCQCTEFISLAPKQAAMLPQRHAKLRGSSPQGIGE